MVGYRDGRWYGAPFVHGCGEPPAACSPPLMVYRVGLCPYPSVNVLVESCDTLGLVARRERTRAWRGLIMCLSGLQIRGSEELLAEVAVDPNYLHQFKRRLRESWKRDC